MRIFIDPSDIAQRQRAESLASAERANGTHLLEPLVASDAKDNFKAQMEVRQIGSVSVSRCWSTQMSLVRTHEAIARQRLRAMALVRLDTGTTVFTFNDRAPSVTMQLGEFIVFDADTPSLAEVGNDTEATYLLIPYEAFQPYLGAIANQDPCLVSRKDPLHAMLYQCFEAYVAMLDPAPDVADGAFKVLVHLLALLRDRTANNNPVGPGGSQADAKRRRVLEFIRSRLEDPRLNPQMIATHLGISARSLHQLFEATGETVAARIVRLRTDRARELLVADPARTTLDIGLACGFESAATFYRSFAKIHGVPPGEYRRTHA